MIKKIIKNKSLFSFLLCTLLGFLIVIFNIIHGYGIYYLIDDFNLQQIPFNMINNYLIKNGEILFSWYNDLGSSFIPTYSFYNLFSPFNMIGYLFPSKVFPYLIGPIFILKYGFAGLFSYLFLKRYVKNKNYAILGSVIYTFSGFQLTNILFYHFHDVVVFFPLLLYTLDNLVYDGKKGRFLLVISLCAFTNWFFFIEEVIFLVLYYLVKIITHDYKFTWRSFFSILLEGLLGTLITMFVLLPTFLFTLNNGRLTSTWTLKNMFLFFPSRYLEIIKSFLLPAQSMSLGKRSLISAQNYSSSELYLPLVGFIFCLSYIFKNPKKSYTIITIISFIFMFIPILNSSFVLFNSTYYLRWAFMPLLIMTLMTIKSIESYYSIKLSTVLITLANIVFTLIIIIKRDTLVFDSKSSMIIIFVSFLDIILCNLIYYKKSIKRLKYITLFTCLFVILYGNFITFLYTYNNYWNNKNYREYIKYNSEFKVLSDSRSNSSSSCPSNLSNTKRIHAIRSFNSNTSGSVFTFFNSIGIERSVYTLVDINDKKLNDFLGVKYIIRCDNDDVEKSGYKFFKKIDNYDIYINDDYLDFGSSFDEYISSSSFNKLSNDDKITTLNKKIVLSDNQISKYKYLFSQNVLYTKNEFEFIKNGFTSNIISSDDTFALYQIPFDDGWVATNNGKKIKIENVDNGFIGIKINKGENNIIFKYKVPGLKIGIIISIISLLTSIIYLFICKRNVKLG